MSITEMVRNSFEGEELQAFDLLCEKAKRAYFLSVDAQCRCDEEAYMRYWSEYGSWKYLIEDCECKRLAQIMGG